MKHRRLGALPLLFSIGLALIEGCEHDATMVLLGSGGEMPEIELVWLPPGTFIMGSPATEEGRVNSWDRETQHRVTLSRGFWIGKYEITQEEWEAVMGGNPSRPKNVGTRAPVENVTWVDCQRFLRRLNAIHDGAGKFRLPTEAEWEYACRAGTRTAYSAGASESDLAREGWYRHNSGTTVHSVGQKRPNAFGLYDMHGNVYEWCQDRFAAYSSDAVTDPTGPSSGDHRVLRGGSYFYSPAWCRSAHRQGADPTFVGIYGRGVRVVLSR